MKVWPVIDQKWTDRGIKALRVLPFVLFTAAGVGISISTREWYIAALNFGLVSVLLSFALPDRKAKEAAAERVRRANEALEQVRAFDQYLARFEARIVKLERVGHSHAEMNRLSP